jgi:hypothetical protein
MVFLADDHSLVVSLNRYAIAVPEKKVAMRKNWFFISSGKLEPKHIPAEHYAIWQEEKEPETGVTLTVGMISFSRTVRESAVAKIIPKILMLGPTIEFSVAQKYFEEKNDRIIDGPFVANIKGPEEESEISETVVKNSLKKSNRRYIVEMSTLREKVDQGLSLIEIMEAHPYEAKKWERYLDLILEERNAQTRKKGRAKPLTRNK